MTPTKDWRITAATAWRRLRKKDDKISHGDVEPT